MSALIIVLIVVAYWAPSITGMLRHVTNTGSVIVVNLVFGWTIIGWGIAMAMAVRTSQVPRAGRAEIPAGSYSVKNIFRRTDRT